MAKPKMILIAGPNGSGKSTMTDFLMKKGMDFGVYINPDAIALSLSGTPIEIAKKAQHMAQTQRLQLLENSVSHSFESVMSHPSKIEYLMLAKTKGFHVILLFVGIDDPLINVKRVENRVAKGGHDVPVDKIVNRYQRTMEMLYDAAIAADEAIIFDNTDDNLGLMEGARVVGGKLEKFDARFGWIRQYLVNKFPK